jgi:hypothetical protein
MLMIGYFKVTTAESITKKCTGGENRAKAGRSMQRPYGRICSPQQEKGPSHDD